MAETQTIILDLQTTGAEQVEKNLDKVAEAAAAANENVEKLGESTNKSLEKGKKSTDDLSKSLQGAESAASGFSGALAVLGLEDTWLDNLSSGVGNLLQFKGGITEGVKGAQSLAKATKGASVAQRIFNAAMNANPIFLLSSPFKSGGSFFLISSKNGMRY